MNVSEIVLGVFESHDQETQYMCCQGVKCKGFTPLMRLVLLTHQHPELDQYISGYCSRHPEQLSKQNDLGWTPLMLAARNSNNGSSNRTVEVLISGSDLNLQNKDGWTALMSAARYSNNGSTERTVELLIPGSNLDQQDNEGWTALMMASMYSNTDSTNKTVELLIPGSNLNLQNRDGWSALILVAGNTNTTSNERTAELLIAGSNLNLQCKGGWTPLMLAARYSNTDSTERTVEMLISGSNLNQKNENGWTALMLAARYSDIDSTCKTVEMLIPGSDLSLKLANGNTAISIVLSTSKNDSGNKVLEILLSHTPVPSLQEANELYKLLKTAKYSGPAYAAIYSRVPLGRIAIDIHEEEVNKYYVEVISQVKIHRKHYERFVKTIGGSKFKKTRGRIFYTPGSVGEFCTLSRLSSANYKEIFNNADNKRHLELLGINTPDKMEVVETFE